MDPTAFDRLTKLISASASRRGVLAALLGAPGMPLRSPPETSARRRKTNGRDRRRKAKKRKRKNRGAPAGQCCNRQDCTPGSGKNLGRCCFQDRDLTARNFQGANLGGASFARADLTAAHFAGANLDQTCFVDANTTGTRFGNANRGTAIFCRTETSSGVDNSGCGKGTPCCPTCDAAHPCAAGQVCCQGRCLPGECCDNGEQSTCGTGNLCCGHRCVAGDCCAVADCPVATCQRRACDDHQCVYSPVSGEPGPDCPDPRICCEDAAGAAICCAAGVTICQASGVCGCAGNQDCGSGEVCCGEQCQRGVCCQDQDCPQETCQERHCQDHQCVYTPVSGEPGPRCDTICCQDAAGAPRCCPEGTATCDGQGLCCTAQSRDQTCAVGTTEPKCGEVTNNCGQRVDCGPCAVRTCQEGTCTGAGNTCAYTPVFGTTGPQCPTVCCRSENALPVCCEAGTTTCTVSGLCRCASNQDCAGPELCCAGRCREPVWANQTTFGSEGVFVNAFRFPRGVAVAADERTAWVADSGNDRISIWGKQANGSWDHLTNFGRPIFGPSEFSQPIGVAVTPDGLGAVVGDRNHHRVSIWLLLPLPIGWLNAINFGSRGSGPDQFSFPEGVAVDAQAETIFVADRNNHRISVWTIAGGSGVPQTTFGSGPGSAANEFNNPTDVAVSDDGQTAWVTDTFNGRVSIWTRQANGSWAHQINFGRFGSGPDQFDFPIGVAVAADGRTAWVADVGNDRVSIWTRSGGDWVHRTTFGSGPGSGPGQLNSPGGVAISRDGETAWVADSSNDRVSIWSVGCPA